MEYIISQFADDTDLYLAFEQETVTATFQVLSDIEKCTGLKVSYEKTTLYRIGSLCNSNAKLITPRKVNWENDYTNTLGIDVCSDVKKRNQNVSSVIVKLKTVANMWYFRTMTLLGKVTVVNSLMASLFIYKMQVLPMFDQLQVDEINQVIEDFIWGGKRPKIKLNVLQANKEDGGLGLVDVKTKHFAILCNWLNDCESNLEIKNLAKVFLGETVCDNLIWQFNLSGHDSKLIFRAIVFGTT